MRAPQLSPATWLGPWQAPETLEEQMVSTRSEVYSLTAVIWEVWAGEWWGRENIRLSRSTYLCPCDLYNDEEEEEGKKEEEEEE